MTQGSWQLSGRCIQAHHLSSPCGQQVLPDMASSSSGTWWWTWLHHLWLPYPHYGSARKAICHLFKVWTQDSWDLLDQRLWSQKGITLLGHFDALPRSYPCSFSPLNPEKLNIQTDDGQTLYKSTTVTHHPQKPTQRSQSTVRSHQSLTWPKWPRLD